MADQTERGRDLMPMLRHLRAGGMSYTKAAEELNRLGFRTVKGCKFRSSTLVKLANADRRPGESR